MRPILVIEQDERLAGAGLLGRRLDGAGTPWRLARAWCGELDGVRLAECAAIAPLGGNAHAWDERGHPFLRVERALLAEAVEQDVPVLGICLGAQLLARALGAEVGDAGVHEVGWQQITPTPEALRDPLLGHLARPAGVYQWHVDAFELPVGATLLARSELVPNQAFRIGSAWGVQFHPEVDYETFTVWLANHPGACAELGIDEVWLRAAVEAGSSRDFAWRARFFDAFVELVLERESA